MNVLHRGWLRLLLLLCLLPCFALRAHADARFDLIGPKIDVRVTRNDVTLPISQVPNLQAGDKLWLHPDLPPTQSVRYLLICVFLRGTTNPPPPEWFTRIQTWDRHVREEGVFVTVPPEAQQALLFMAPETGGDFSTLRSTVMGRPGVFVRASQDLDEAGFEQARIEKYLADIRRVPPGDSVELQKRSDLLARTLALKPNPDCFKRPVDTQFTCLTQSGNATLLDDAHAQSVVSALANGPSSDFINAASYTALAGGGLYSAYVGAVVDLVRLLSGLHTAQYQYIPAIAFPQADSLNLRLNTPPSFKNPKSVIVIGLPAIHSAVEPPLRQADPKQVVCLLAPLVTLPIEGAPLVFATDLGHDFVLHLNTPPGAPAEADIPLAADAYQGGLVLQQNAPRRVPLRDVLPAAQPVTIAQTSSGPAAPKAPAVKPPAPQPEPVQLTATVRGEWGFDSFTGPTVTLQQLPGARWQIVPAPHDAVDGSASAAASPATMASLIAGKESKLTLSSTGSACVHRIIGHSAGEAAEVPLSFAADEKSSIPNLLTVELPSGKGMKPGSLHLQIQQYGQPQDDQVATRTFAEPAEVTAMHLHAADTLLHLEGERLDQVASVAVGDLTFAPQTTEADDAENSLVLTLPVGAKPPPTHAGQSLTAVLTLKDGRSVRAEFDVLPPRPSIVLLSKTASPMTGNIALPGNDDLPLSSTLTFTLKSRDSFPRNGRIEIETLDGALRTVLTLAPSGGLVLQDPHTVVASLDPLRSFGPSAFGKLRLRALYPEKSTGRHAAEASGETAGEAAAEKSSTDPAAGSASEASSAEEAEPASNWIDLTTLVRLPALTQLQCPADATLPCVLDGSNLFLLQSVAAAPSFSDSSAVPDGFTGTSLSVPHCAGGLVYLHLRDDPAMLVTATLPVPVLAAPAKKSSAHGAVHAEAAH
jgi:hypothetical protein